MIISNPFSNRSQCARIKMVLSKALVSPGLRLQKLKSRESQKATMLQYAETSKVQTSKRESKERVRVAFILKAAEERRGAHSSLK